MSSDTASQFKELSQAYEVLSDPEKREIYDQYGEDALKEGMGGAGPSHSPFDIFESLFGGGGFGGKRWFCYCFFCVLLLLALSMLGSSILIFFHKSFLCLGGGGSRGRRLRRGEDVVHSLKVSLEDLYNGTTKKLSLSRNALCVKCKGYVFYHRNFFS